MPLTFKKKSLKMSSRNNLVMLWKAPLHCFYFILPVSLEYHQQALGCLTRRTKDCRESSAPEPRSLAVELVSPPCEPKAFCPC